MPNAACTRSRIRQWWLCTLSGLLCLSALLSTPALTGEALEDWKKDLLYETRVRISQHIRALDAAPALRSSAINELVEQAKGENRPLVLSQLQDAFSIRSLQLKEGIVDTLVRIGDPASMSFLIRHLHYTPHGDLRRWILQMLPAFLIDDERQRLHVIEMLETESNTHTKRLSDLLQQEPFRKEGGNFSPALYRHRDVIENAIASQLDPIGTAVEGLDSKRDGMQARAALAHFCGRLLGQTREEWRRTWRQFSQDIKKLQTLQLEELQNIQTLACKMIILIGADGTPHTADLLQRLTHPVRPRATLSALNAIHALTSLAQTRYAASLQQNNENITEMQRTWQTRRTEAMRRLITLADTAGTEALLLPDPLLRAAASHCLAASAEPLFPSDTTEEIARKTTHTKHLVDMLHSFRITKAKTPLVLEALCESFGRIDSVDAVSELIALSAFKTYSGKQSEQHGEYRVVRAAIEGLGHIVKHGNDASSHAAASALIRLLANERQLLGAPLRPLAHPGDTKRNRYSIADLARYQLQKVLRVSPSHATATEWLEHYKDFRAARKAH